MNTIWQQLMLAQLPLAEWRGASYAYHLVGLFHRWQHGSWFMRHSDVISLWLLTLFFGMAPFVSTTMMSVLLIGCALFWLILTLADGAKDSPSKAGLTPIHLLVMLYWGISVVATGLSPVRMAAIEGLSKLTLYLLLFVFMARVLRSTRLRNWLIGIYLHVALLVSSYGIRQWIFGAPPLATWSDPESSLGNMTRVYSYLRNPNLLAGYVIPAIAFSVMAIFAWKRPTAKFLAAVMAVVNTLCLVFTFSRAGWMALVVMMISSALLLGYWFYLFRRKWVLPALLGGMAAFLVLSVIVLPPVRARVLSLFIGRGDSSNNFRLNVWQSVLNMIKARPILGIGPGNDAFNKIYPAFSRTKFTALGAYSVPLEILVETGFLGFAAFTWLIAVTFHQGSLRLDELRKAKNEQGFWLIGAIVTMIGHLVQGLSDTVWYRPQVNSLWWMAVAIIASFYVSPNSKADSSKDESWKNVEAQ
jgi:putative inorganic carbon (hco3(-)) transporter